MTIADEIIAGVHDHQLTALLAAIGARNAALYPTPKFIFGQKSILDFKVGDAVRFNEHARPAYLQGVVVQVTKVNQTRVKVRMPAEVGMRFGQKEVSCPISIIDKLVGA